MSSPFILPVGEDTGITVRVIGHRILGRVTAAALLSEEVSTTTGWLRRPCDRAQTMAPAAEPHVQGDRAGGHLSPPGG
ncbi:hypothetical protein GDO81_020207 [Engystomops pustulosus]|uniref:Uncharacterized protein n=1 Tax=Engystomops pustulosus TaxID=76066 RepID=A0AAV6ZEL8_ENGPU|nr:hypothetical protein GDO81_020207 [Engystomops pustulosus]